MGKTYKHKTVECTNPDCQVRFFKQTKTALLYLGRKCTCGGQVEEVVYDFPRSPKGMKDWEICDELTEARKNGGGNGLLSSDKGQDTRESTEGGKKIKGLAKEKAGASGGKPALRSVRQPCEAGGTPHSTVPRRTGLRIRARQPNDTVRAEEIRH